MFDCSKPFCDAPGRRHISPNNQFGKELAPNPWVQPFAYKRWEIVGNLLEFHETSNLNQQQKPWKEFFYRFSRSFAGVFGLVVFIILVICALVIPPVLSVGVENGMSGAFDPDRLDYTIKYLSFYEQGHIFGTDALGRDVFARLWSGIRYSLTLAVVVTLIQVTFGMCIGIIMGHFRMFDRIMTFIIKVISNVPSIIILIVFTIILKPTFWVMVFALTFTSWTCIANQMRSQVLRAKSFEWVSASKILGTPTYKVLFNYLPVVIPILVTEIVFSIPGVILSETSLAFIGLSLDNATLGNLITEGSKIFVTYPRYVLIPSFMLIIVTTSIQLISASVQDSLLRQR
ncbi:ABC transporter permease [Mycoplasma sp. Mirounga ES2805-ORL]|uniref:ABC transporter permease n=1 Tax=Mycoplasma sp. Mirounga ES2805-ORL TaxID=754514 RepID=UPI00197C1925|nr:ABC transporter permease [Mycoplasma sp. Mirounga ES2805-ORL]QSF13728.1 ABC transporter permease [Mycoplasma sp. Mirounga ES2805-ORL]